MAEYLAALLWKVIWNVEHVPKELGVIAKGISKQSVENAMWFLFVA